MPDSVITVMTLVILAIGITMIMTSSSAYAVNNKLSPYYFAVRQMKLAAVGAAAALAAALIPYRWFRFFALPAVILTGLTLVLVHVPAVSVTKNGATRWIELAGIQFQPSETAKLALILFLAWWLARAPARKLRQVLIPLFVTGLFLFLIIKEPDLGTAVIIAGSCYFLFLQTELSARWFLAALPLGTAALTWVIGNNPYQMNRIKGWLDPWADPNGIGLQYVQAQLAFARGELFGVGVGASEQKYWLPESHTDSIFAIIGEELGFFLTLMLIVFFGVLIFRCFAVASKCRDDFGRYLTFGLTTMLALQICVNMAVMTGLMPITGVTLPLISHGGTSLITTMFSIGVVLSVSRG
ncbi:MAG: putative lipid II flippase FtsW [Gracilibacteraceae bacterium]|nr:putative lipid II flippase FtsW [Gracilibacteraceae bacterium]